MRRPRLAVVTGAQSYLARRLVARLELEGWTVWMVTRQISKSAAPRVLSWKQLWEDRAVDLATVDAVFHLAAFRPPDLEDARHAEECLATNANLTLRLAEETVRGGRARFLYCSAGNIYGAHTEPVAEDAAPALAGRACFYLASKYLGEIFVERTRRVLGLVATSFRVSSLYGPGMPAHDLVARFVTLARQGAPLPVRNGGLDRFDLVHVDDVVDLLCQAAEPAAPQGVYHAGSGEAVPVLRVGELVNEVFQSAAGLDVAPAAVPAVALGFAPLSLDHVRKAFRYAPRDLRTGLAEYRRWLEEESHG